MTDEELKKKLSVLKTAAVPKGYAEKYWSRLKYRLTVTPAARKPGSSVVNDTGSPLTTAGMTLRWSFAVLLFTFAGYWFGSSTSTPTLRPSDAPLRLISHSSEPDAQRVFREMIALFPNRVNWISFIDGQVDFSISSVAHPDSKALIPLVVELPRAKDAWQARLLVRPGQKVSAEGVWEKSRNVIVTLTVSADGKEARVECRLEGRGSIEVLVPINKEGVQPLGSLRDGERLVQVQLLRPAASEEKEGHNVVD